VRRHQRLLFAVLATLLLALSAGLAQAADTVTPITWSNFRSQPADADSLDVRTALRNANEYTLTTWWNTDANFDAQDRDTYLTFTGVGEQDIRPVASAAFGLAVSLKTGAYDATHTGVSESTARARALKLIRSLAYRHRATAGAPGWGNSDQSALWAEQAGAAGWFMWDDLTTTERDMVADMVWYEATLFIGYQVPYWKDVLGNYVGRRGDTRAEDDAWNAMPIHLAMAMFPTHRLWEAWSYKAAELTIGAWARPADLTATTTWYGGRRIPEWLYGTNIEDNGTLWNHDKIHPDYMVTKTLNLHAPAYFSLAAMDTPTYVHHNADRIYDALVDVTWSSPPYLAPGGTMYVPSSADVYYPYRTDWGTGRRMIFANFDVQARAYGWDALASPDPETWEDLHVDGLLAQQARHADGHTFANDTEDNYPGKEQVVSEEIGAAWLTKWLMAQSGAYRAVDYDIPVVQDNRDREFTVQRGTWTLYSTSATEPDVMGDDARYNAAGTGSDVVRFRPYLSERRSYTVYAWWNAFSNQATNAPFRITHSGGTTTVRVDQTRSSGQWVSLGSYTCPIGNTCYVELSDDANGYVIADAVKFE